MLTSKLAQSMKNAINDAPRNAYVAELHLQVIKHSQELCNVSGLEFCEALQIPVSYGTEFKKMLKIAPRLIGAGLDVDQI